MSLLDSIRGPQDLKRVPREHLPELAGEIRELLIDTCSRNGSGHIGPNLGVVELTIALHRVFDSPSDPILWDVGHQAYVHKLLTGRAAEFGTLRQEGGLSGYPSQAESPHDFIENSHASTSLSYADGMAKAFRLRGDAGGGTSERGVGDAGGGTSERGVGDKHRHVVAVIGDGSLTGGMAWEALNNIAANRDLRVTIVVNDNGWSYSPTIGGLASHLSSLRMTQGYEHVLDVVRRSLAQTPLVGQPLYDALHGIKKGIKDVVSPQAMFEDLGLKYVGPIDGHDEAAVEDALRAARRFGRPAIVHVRTRKGYGYAPAENDEEDHLHQWRPASKSPSWTNVFSEELVRLGAERDDIVAITAAMLYPTGLAPFAQEYPDRCFDVGIAEQHAVTSAAGLALGGLHPVVAIYATFLNRAFDQVLMDVALHRLPVTFVLDRAGVTGDDGPSHNGMWDMSLLQVVPGLRLAAPRDGVRLRELLREAVAISDGPTALRFPKGALAESVEAAGRIGSMDVLRYADQEPAPQVLLVAAGPTAQIGLDAADLLAAQGIGATVIDPRWVKPLDGALIDEAGRHRLVAVIEDNGVVGGVGDAVARLLRDAGSDVPVLTFGIPQRFLEHAKRPKVLSGVGLTAQDVARGITEAVTHRSPVMIDLGTT